VMAALVLVDGARLAPAEFSEFLAAQPDLSPKAWPRHVWITDKLPTTATNKILKRQLSGYGSQPPGGLLWTRPGRDTSYTGVDRSAKAQVSPG
jgi:fatty-acyl-CoA synthase